jgi:hypothetical protein
MLYDHLTPLGHPLPFLGQVKQTCPKVQVAPEGFVDDPAPKPNYLPGVKPETAEEPPPAPEYEQPNRFLPITIAVLVFRGVMALIKRMP